MYGSHHRLPTRVGSSPDPGRVVSGESPLPILILVEGFFDMEFLRRLSSHLHQVDNSIPDLRDWETTGRIIFVPIGGGHISAWTHRFASLQCPEFHLYDRETEPETSLRQQAVQVIAGRPGCQAKLLSKRSLENYLHPAAIVHAGGGCFPVHDDQNLALLVAEVWYSRVPADLSWNELSGRAKRRFVSKAKRWLNSRAVDHMSLGMLRQRDPQGELLSWLRSLAFAAVDRS